MLQERWRIAKLRTVGPELFHPRPAVDSTIVRFVPRPPGELAPHSPEIYREVVKRGFSQRRKQLHNNLQLEKEKAGDVFGAMGLLPSARAEELSLEQWVDLSNRLDPHPCSLLPPAATESLDVVDENDVVINTLPRREIHAGKHLHRAVHVFVRNKLGEIYLQFRSHLKDTHGLKWDSSASGHVDPGESYHDCAVREMWEEIWVEPKGDLERIARIDASEATDLEFIEVFLGEAKGRLRIHGKEVDSGRWFSPEFIEEWIARRPQDFATGFITCFKAWLAG
jgi:16S rRNA (adenine1518-N6/adenine1519-N6)-dimethyltransferase